MLVALIPPLVTAHAFGHRKALVAAGVVTVAVFVLVVYPLGNAMRYDPAYERQLAAGGLFVPEVADVWDMISEAAASSDVAARLNQTSLLAYSVERQGDGLALLSEAPYVNALETLMPRALVPDRADMQIQYDLYTGYSVLFRGYNDWGIHTEAFLSFGWVGVVAILAALGYVWQKVYCLLARLAFPFGWAIAAAVLLPTLFRVGEYNFLAAVVSPTKILLLAVVCSWGALVLARWALSARRR